MKIFLVAVVALALFAPMVAEAGEHPTEPSTSRKSGQRKHGRRAKSRKKAGKKVKAAKAAKAAKWVEHKKTMKAFVKAVKGHVKMKVADEGSFKVYDDKLDKTWELRLLRIHKKRIARLGKNKFFACADFRTIKRGKGRRELDLDFFVSRDGEDFFVDEVLIHKVEGKPRYTYNSKNQRIPYKKHRVHKKLRRGKEHPKAKKKPKTKEHPAGSEHPR